MMTMRMRMRMRMMMMMMMMNIQIHIYIYTDIQSESSYPPEKLAGQVALAVPYPETNHCTRRSPLKYMHYHNRSQPISNLYTIYVYIYNYIYIYIFTHTHTFLVAS